MSCNGCRVLRKGCSENCILRPCLQWIESPEAQGHATVFVAKFFGRAGLMSFISAVPENQRPALFQSLLFEAAGRTVNPVNGAVGLLGTGNWQVCQAAVETVLRGGTLRAIPDHLVGGDSSDLDETVSECTTDISSNGSKMQKRRRKPDEQAVKVMQLADLDLSLTPGFEGGKYRCLLPEKRRLGSPSMNSEESGTTTCFESNTTDHQAGTGRGPKLLSLFN
ncbi:unnamed protein product [Coffea canephora]|uniref:LOB domain-containing protein n=1 Tax=Coffea canephora TaxID=49390 RepID=A0A068U215_COFCA|nr:unnamed protein product [Coffea canephora]